MTPINLDSSYDEFVLQLNSRALSRRELEEARHGLLQRVEQINAQLAAPSEGRGVSWKVSVTTARKYFQRKIARVNEKLGVVSDLPDTRKAPGHGFLMTFLHRGDYMVLATKRNPADLWADMVAEEGTGSPPALIAYLSLTADAAKALPESIWADDL